MKADPSDHDTRVAFDDPRRRQDLGPIAIIVGDAEDCPTQDDLERYADLFDHVRAAAKENKATALVFSGYFPIQIVGARGEDGLLRFAGKRLVVRVLPDGEDVDAADLVVLDRREQRILGRILECMPIVAVATVAEDASAMDGLMAKLDRMRDVAAGRR